jgi:hypothetical protein
VRLPAVTSATRPDAARHTNALVSPIDISTSACGDVTVVVVVVVDVVVVVVDVGVVVVVVVAGVVDVVVDVVVVAAVVVAVVGVVVGGVGFVVSSGNTTPPTSAVMPDSSR